MSINEAIDQHSIDNIESWESKHSENNSEFYLPLERIERKLNAIIEWINWFAKENSFVGAKDGNWSIEGKFTTLPTIDFEDCEKKDKDSE